MMKFEGQLKVFAGRLLQDRLDGKLRECRDVFSHAQACQPAQGFSNAEWDEACKFILRLEPANIIPEAKKLADEYGLTLEY